MNPPLGRYSSKRTLSHSPEPAARVPHKRRGPLLFVVQKHSARRLHYDFRLELDGVLKSWAVPKGPSMNPGEKRLAVEVEDHPFDYAAFEGVIPEKQYGAGQVIVWDAGVYSPDEGHEYSFEDRKAAEKRVRSEIANGKLSLLLRGEKLKGSFALVRTSTSKQWLLIKHKDRFATIVDALAESRSVLSGRKVEEVDATSTRTLTAGALVPTGPAEAMPPRLSPMLAEVGDGPGNNPDWLYEPKLDGHRVLAFVRDRTVTLLSRRGQDLTASFPEIVAALSAQCIESMILDGELVAMTADGRPSFNALQNRAKLKTAPEIAAGQRQAPVAMVCFDLLHFAGLNLRGQPYVDRRRYLAQCLLPTEHLQLVHVSEDGESLYRVAVEQGFEGIVAKRKDSTYIPGRRSSSWRKIKATHTGDFVVGGFTKGKGSREAIGALLLGQWHGRKFAYVGHVGSGLSPDLVARLRGQLAELVRKDSPFSEKPDLHRPTTWVDPKLVVEVEYHERTPAGLLRAPVFLHVRDDLAARDIRSAPSDARGDKKGASRSVDHIAGVLEQLASTAKQLNLRVGGAQLKATNLEREYWPADKRMRTKAITKRDLLRYLAAVSPHMLPHLRDRPLTMIRMPQGIEGERFFQKHWLQDKPDFVETITVYSDTKSESHEYILGNNLATLLWLGQVGTLEFHVWHSRAHVTRDCVSRSTDYSSSLESMEASVLNYPDYLVFDIDPYIYSGKEAKGAEPELNRQGFAAGRRVAFWLRDLLRQMSLEARVKTSGKTGLHVFVPIERTVTFDEARAITETIGRHVMREHPKDITMEWAVTKRTGKIFIDYNMNVRAKTLNVAYSPRGVPTAPVSMPLLWEELEAAEPLDFTVANVVERLGETPARWRDILESKQSLARAFENGRKGSPSKGVKKK